MPSTISPSRDLASGCCGAGIAAWAASHPKNPAILGPGGVTVAYADLHGHLNSTRDRLRAIGAGRGTRVALVTGNGPVAATAFLGIASACACAPLNPAYRKEELAFYLRDLRADFIATDRPPDSPAQAAAREAGVPVLNLIADGGLCRFEAGELAGLPSEDGPPEAGDIALLLHTSGTTSRPKLVPLLHRNLAASAGSIARTLALTPADRCLNIMPLFHIHGLAAALLATLATGGSVVSTDGTYGTGFFDWLEEFAPTWYTAVPAMHMAIAARARENAAIVARRPLRLIRSSSAALPPRVLHELEAAFGAPVVEAYGMTEAAHQMASNPLPPAARKPGSVGPCAGAEIAILGESGELLEGGATGEVVVRGPGVTPGYLDNPAANESAFRNGWFRTGDQGWMDADGYLHLTGRLKEIINRGGEKISPREIDEVLLDHPAVEQAVAFAVPHAQLGEEVGAAVVLRKGATARESDLRGFAAARLAAFKVPRVVRILAEIPKGPTGKTQRGGLAERLGVPAIDGAAPVEFVEPETALERQIRDIWSRHLRRKRIGALDAFGALGGDSHQAARMLAEVVETTSLDLPFFRFLEQGTIRSLAEDIEAARAAPPTDDLLVELQPKGTEPPLVCIPGHDAVALGYARLARLLGDRQPVYGLRTAAPRAGSEEWTIEEFAEAYAEAISARFGDAPVRLAGVCFGGVAAFETARRLASMGRTPSLLVLMDTINPDWRAAAGAAGRAIAQVRMGVERIAEHGAWLHRWPGGPLEYAGNRWRAFARNRHERRMAASLRTGERGPGTVGAAILRRLASLSYRPGPYSGRVCCIRIRGVRPVVPMMGWSGIATGEFEVREVDYAPEGMLAESSIQEVVRHIREAMG